MQSHTRGEKSRCFCSTSCCHIKGWSILPESREIREGKAILFLNTQHRENSIRSLRGDRPDLIKVAHVVKAFLSPGMARPAAICHRPPCGTGRLKDTTAAVVDNTLINLWFRVTELIVLFSIFWSKDNTVVSFLLS